MYRPMIWLTVLVLSAPALAAAEADDLLGTWLTAEHEDGRSHVEIRRQVDGYVGTIRWLEIPRYPPDDARGMGGQAKVDRENPDPELQTRPVIGLEILGGFRYAGNGQWKGGTIYDPANGKTYKCKMQLRQDGSLKVRGFIGVSALGRTTYWTRVEDQPTP